MFLSPADAASIARRARQLHQTGALTHAQWAILDSLLWACRKPGQAVTLVSYSTIQKLAHAARDTIAEAIRRFEALGILQRTRRRFRVSWGPSVASRQAMNSYVFRATTTELDGRGEKREIQIHVETGGMEQAQAALAAVRERRERFLITGGGKRREGGGWR